MLITSLKASVKIGFANLTKTTESLQDFSHVFNFPNTSKYSTGRGDKGCRNGRNDDTQV